MCSTRTVLAFVVMVMMAGCAPSERQFDYRHGAGAGGADQLPGSPTGTPTIAPFGGGDAVGTGADVSTGGIATGASATAPGVKERVAVSFSGSKGDSVPGYLFLPAREVGQKFPAVILMYGLGGDKDNRTINQAGEILAESGIAALTLDWPGTGGRGNIGSDRRIMDKTVLEWTVGDYGAALRYLQANPFVEGTRVGYVGASMGAMTGIVFASRTPAIKAVVALVPIINPLWGADAPEAKIRVLNRPVLCVSSNGDGGASQTVCSGVSNRVHIDAAHELDGQETVIINRTRDFLKQSL